MKEDAMVSAKKLEAIVRAKHSRFSLINMLMRLGARNEHTRTAFLRFVDAFSGLQSAREAGEYFSLYMDASDRNLPWHIRVPAFFMRAPLMREIGGALIRTVVEKIFAPHFVIGDFAELARIESRYRQEGAGIVADILGEEVLTNKEAEEYMERYRQLIGNTSLHDKEGDENGATFHVAVKFSSLYPFFSPHNWQESKRVVAKRFAVLLHEAKRTNTHITVDAEHWQTCHLTEEIFLDTIMRDEFCRYPHVGIALQAYRRDSMRSAIQFVQVAHKRIAPFTVRLIKGAYWDTEVILADQHGWQMPLFTRKEHTDKQYALIANYLLAHRRNIHSVFGTHNPHTISCVLNMGKHYGITPEIQVLYGLGEQVRKALCQISIPVRVYAPVGDLRQGMAYFARRVLENTANESILLQLMN